MTGGLGDDVFHVDSRSDKVFDGVDGGNDTVLSSVSFRLASGQEIETLRLLSSTGNASLKLTGNEFDNALIGNGGANTLDGKGGADTLRGLAGNDTYVVDDPDDVVMESSAASGGGDTVRASVDHTLSNGVERLQFTGSGDTSGTGNSGNNAIYGNGGDNTLAGGLGNDLLVGGGGDDSFVFDTEPGSGNVDRIQGFSVDHDTIVLDNAVYRGLQNGPLQEDQFKDITDGAELDADDRVLYDHDSGRLWYDADGSGSDARVSFAILDDHPRLTFQDVSVA